MGLRCPRAEAVGVCPKRNNFKVGDFHVAPSMNRLPVNCIPYTRRTDCMPPVSERARIGIIGTGWWATYAHLPSLTSYPRAEVVAIADPSANRLAQAGEHFGIGAQYTDYQAMLDRGDLDGVVVATPHTTHYAVAREVLTRGIPLMLEKPMVLRARDARELVDLADQHGVSLVIGYPYQIGRASCRERV